MKTTLKIANVFILLCLLMLPACGGGGGGGGSTPTYRVTYNSNGAGSGSVPVDDTNYAQGNTVTVLGNTGSLVRDGYTFAGWCINANGTGDSYTQGDSFTMGSADITLYAKWTPIYEISYDGNGADSGDVPLDATSYEEGDEVTVLGNTGSLARDGYTFAGWCVNADGTGDSYTEGDSFTIGSADITLYAKWSSTTTGIPDTDFDIDGIVTTSIGTGSSEAYALAIQDDGKIVAAGVSMEVAMSYSTLARYNNTDGTLDLSFGTDGIVTTLVGSSSIFQALCIQDDGKIVAVGYTSNGSDNDFALVRYNTDGTLDTDLDSTPDTTFGSGGIVTTPVGIDDRAYALCIQDDGKIVAAGHTYDGANAYFVLVRYDTDGTLDPTFGSGGIVITQVGPGPDDRARALAIQSDGKIVAAGYTYDGANAYFALVRYNTDGTLDTDLDGTPDITFGSGGVVTTQVGTSNAYARALCIQDDGKIVATGYSDNGADNDFALVRYNPDGSLDIDFGIVGIVTTPVGIDDRANALCIQGDGKIVAAGYSSNGTDNDLALVRYNPDGSLDIDFGIVGIVTTQVGLSNDYASALAIQDDGRIVAAGWSWDGFDYFALVRYR